MSERISPLPTQFLTCGIYGVRWQAERDTALRVARQARGAKAPSPLRSAGALHMVAASRRTAMNRHSRVRLDEWRQFFVKRLEEFLVIPPASNSAFEEWFGNVG